MTCRIITGDCREVMAALDSESVHAIITDPPYHLTQISRGGHARTNNPSMPHGRHRIGDKGFMGKVWDGGDVAFRPETWAAALRVAKPGAHLLAFGGTRTYHRLTCAIEDAGWEIRDCLMWVYGSGFPKSRNLEGDWTGWGTALKPAWEPIVMARNPLRGNLKSNIAQHGTGALNIDGCRIETDECLNGGAYTAEGGRTESPSLRAGSGMNVPGKTTGREFIRPAGRWPANLIHDGSVEVVSMFPTEAGAAAPVRRRNGDKFRNTYGAFSGDVDELGSTFQGDAGSAARFFYVPKASRTDRNRGIGGGEQPALGSGATMREKEDADWSARNGNPHPTVKPTELMRYLIKLVTPPGGTVLDCFAGSGSTGLAADIEGFDSILIELDPENAEVARRRIAGDAGLFGDVQCD
jgi:site-specific DNA-methyltransferase (adenine-specific)